MRPIRWLVPIRRIQHDWEPLDRALITYHSTNKDWRVVLFIPLISVFFYLRRRRSGHYQYLNRWVFKVWQDMYRGMPDRGLAADDVEDQRRYDV